MTTQVMVVDDVPAMAEQYAYDLRRVGKYDAVIARGGDEALDALGREPIDCVVLDLEMPGTDGFEVLRRLRQRGIDVPVIVYTGTGTFDRCVQAMRLGAYTFIDKADPVERVAREVETAIERRALLAEVTELRRYAAEDSALRGNSPAMQKLKDAIARVAPIPSPVLVIGESGSGKELVARDIHRLSGRAKEPLALEGTEEQGLLRAGAALVLDGLAERDEAGLRQQLGSQLGMPAPELGVHRPPRVRLGGGAPYRGLERQPGVPVTQHLEDGGDVPLGVPAVPARLPGRSREAVARLPAPQRRRRPARAARIRVQPRIATTTADRSMPDGRAP